MAIIHYKKTLVHNQTPNPKLKYLIQVQLYVKEVNDPNNATKVMFVVCTYLFIKLFHNVKIS
jgi:hypothetical protein